MPSKKKKYNARFPAGRIKKIMQTDEEVGKVAQAVPVIISRTLELFVESLLTKTLRITNARNAKTLSPSHMKQCIISESRFDFLRDLVKNIPDIGVNEEQLSGSEAGYGNEAGASPASTSTSSSSNGGGGGVGQLHGSEPISSAVLLQRSESYTPPSSTSYVSTLPIAPQLQIPTHQPPSQPQPNSSLKRPFNHANSLNFYKEISLEDSSSTTSIGREPPPKLTRLHSAPAASATTTNSIPIKIDILPNLATVAAAPLSSAASSSSNNNNQQSQLKANNGGSVTSSNSFKITYKIAPSNNPPTPTVIEQPVIKLDYSNLKLPMATTVDQSKQPASVPSSSARHLQPTIKIDLSNISSFRNTPTQVQSAPVALMAGSGKPQQHQQVPSTPTTASTPSTPLSALSSASSSGSSICGGSSITSSKNPYVFQQQSVASTSTGSGSAAPLYSSVSSAIPGMDEDYDDI
ncbi:dr1-associated corepressor homolog [Aedes aegypti]|uniref:Transcription factor CBF/NF-Y/archaeal histone domain-containing protein n=1 Tax=Aedes aegypti TaxID=7159 RepID=A0A6I8U0L8_AEDAE|nr:dr1-associated corepressor homolog [Aedes aegypti]